MLVRTHFDPSIEFESVRRAPKCAVVHTSVGASREEGERASGGGSPASVAALL